MYDDRVVIMFGGKIEGNVQKDSVYYLDLNNDDGWKECDVTVPNAGSCNAVVLNDKIIHLLPYSSYTHHCWTDVKDLLPDALV